MWILGLRTVRGVWVGGVLEGNFGQTIVLGGIRILGVHGKG